MVIAGEYSGMSGRAEGRTVYNALTMTGDEVRVLKGEAAMWTVTMDKSMVRLYTPWNAATQSVCISKLPRLNSPLIRIDTLPIRLCKWFCFVLVF